MNHLPCQGNVTIQTSAYLVDEYQVDWDLNFYNIRKFFKRFFPRVRLTKTVFFYLPQTCYYFLPGNIVLCHPAVKQKIIDSIPELQK